MKTKNKQYIKWAGVLLLGIFLGWVLFGGNDDDHAAHADTEAAQDRVWTCSMHPQIRQGEPGDCPLCGMDLIPVEADEVGAATVDYTMSEQAMRLANVESMVVGSGSLQREIRLNGKVQVDERNSYTQPTHIPGRIEQLAINFTGERVQRGQTLATVYSPAMVTAQEELLQAARIRESQPELYRAAREKLRNWRISDAQIDRILEGNTPVQRFPITADVAGVVTEKMVNLGDYVERGMPLYKIADLSRVWVLFDLYENQLAAVSEGDRIEFTVNSLPGETFEGTIDFIDPIISAQTRVATARVVVENNNGRLKPEMFATGTVTAGTEGGASGEIVIPKSAVLWTGKRSVVYLVESADGKTGFRMREVVLGDALGDSYVVKEGLEAGDEIVSNGTFTVDAAVQLSGRASMMNPAAGDNHTAPVLSMEIPEAAEEQLKNVLYGYLELKEALAEDDFNQAKTKAGSLQRAVKEVEAGLFTSRAAPAWNSFQKELNRAIGQLTAAGGIENMRGSFDELSETIIGLARTFNPAGKTLYVQRCPMANNDKGANWLSLSEEIKNPYYGSSMLRCGEVTGIIE